nr:hypothetical protein [Tanacetum cinerariifolium]
MNELGFCQIICLLLLYILKEYAPTISGANVGMSRSYQLVLSLLWMSAVRGLLKEKFNCFTSQLAALTLELQTTKAVLAGRHVQGGNDHGIPFSMPLDVPKFNGSNPDSWIFSINEYISLLETTPERRLRIIGFNLEGDATKWYRWMTRNKLITSWDGLKGSVQNRFGPSKYEDLQGALSCCTQGLKPTIQRELLISKPTSLGNAFGLARVTEARFADHWSTPAVATMRGANTVNQTPTLLPLAIKWISLAERQERLNKGLCFNCDNKWVRGHKCYGKLLLIMADEDDESTGSDAYAEEDEALESGDISILNSLVGHDSPRSLQLWGTVGASEVHVLIDNGSTHSFMRPDVVERMCLPLTATKVFKVYIGSGETLLCESFCAQVPIKLQGFSMDVDLYVLPMQGPDVVLGIQWLQKLGKATHDYAHQTMEFTLANKTYSLQEATSKGHSEIDQLLIQFDSLFQCLQEHKFFIKKSKCVFGAATLEYLGHIISNNGVEMDPKKITTVIDWPVPANQRQKDRFKWGELEFRAFEVRTNHKSIKELMQQVIQTPLQQKYVRKLMGFDFVIEYKPGASNQAADALSLVEVFMAIVVKHHGIPKTIMSNRDLISVSKSWKQLFQFSGNGIEEVSDLPKELYEGYPLEQPLTVCDARTVLRNSNTTNIGAMGRRVSGRSYLGMVI